MPRAPSTAPRAQHQRRINRSSASIQSNSSSSRRGNGSRSSRFRYRRSRAGLRARQGESQSSRSSVRPKAVSQRNAQRSHQRFSSSSPLQRRTNAAAGRQASQKSRGSAAPSIVRSNGDDEDSLDETIMGLEMRKDTIGCAYYVARDETLFLMEDLQLGTLDLVSQLRLFIQPSTVLLCSREHDDTVKVFDPQFNGAEEDSGSDRLPYSMDFRPPAEFDYEAAKIKLVNLHIGAYAGPRVVFAVPGDDGSPVDEEMGHQARMLRLSSLVSTEGRVGCAGAIIAYLQRRRASAYLPGDLDADAFFRISVVSMFTLKDYMFVNVDTVLSLQILQAESHPSAHNQGPTKSSSGSKEGLSVFGLFQYLAKSPQGRIALKQMFLRPLVDIDRINDRLDAVSIFSRPENSAVLSTLRGLMGGIKYVKSMVSNLRKGASSGSGQAGRVANRTWSGLQDFSFHSTQIYKTLGEVIGIEELAITRGFADKFALRDILEVGQKISQIIDFDVSSETLRTAVLQGVDEELDGRKHVYQGIDDLLATVARELKNDIPLGLPQDLKVVYLPQIGFLIALPKDEETGAALFEGLDSEVWEKMFASDDLVYYKDDKMRAMDNHFGDLFTEICDREIEIIHELALEVMKFEESLIAASELCAELDCYLTLAEGAKRYNLCRPRITHENVLAIEGGRHILQELTVPSFIPNDTILAASSHTREDSASTRSRSTSHVSSSSQRRQGPSMLLLTGPNFSGKSVYLKQVALITYLAHIGSFVPATSALIGLTDAILLRVATRESVSRSSSAFMVDLQQVCCALNMATNRSLLVIDEFGKGTAASDGAGLACALLEHLTCLDDAKRPKVVAATHFHEIFNPGVFLANDNVAFAHMEIRLDENAAAASRQHVTYLYNLTPGLSSASFGTVCASLNGIAEDVITRAQELTALQTEGEDLTVACATLSQEEASELVVAERVAREFLTRDVGRDARGMVEDMLESDTFSR
ncbi:MAG: hypothetical protein Q9159_001991 [Coniocarpon cinnabarinum]